ncbi:MAG: hypothetical protein H6834_17575 [Planctomycetes bacterium]|nr:hypothetical protein [Planctomycetota bacterium]
MKAHVGNKSGASIDRALRANLPPDQPDDDHRPIDTNRLASWLDGGMTQDELETFDARTAVSHRTRRILRMFEGHVPIPAPELSATTSRRTWPWLALATVAASIVVWLTIRASTTNGRSEMQILASEARSLGFQAIPLHELLDKPPALEVVHQPGQDLPEARPESRLRALWPSGHVLDPNIVFHWSPPQMESLVIVRHVSGTILCQARGKSPLRLSPDHARLLTPGQTFIWELSAQGASLGDDPAAGFPLESSTPRIFTIAGDGERAHFREFQERARNRPLEDLLVAHYALRLDHVRQAEQPARRFLAREPDSRLGLATLWQALSRLESPEADAVLRRFEALEGRSRAAPNPDANGPNDSVHQSDIPPVDTK